MDRKAQNGILKRMPYLFEGFTFYGTSYGIKNN
ncbi:hypothetical protein AbauAttikon1_0016 [Acinetobacter phage Abau_Attikon1]